MISAKFIFNKITNKENKHDFANKAAVLVPLVHINDQLHLLFEIRSAKLKWQPGDICFPGGRIESSDNSIIDAAIRETYEELGIVKNTIRIYGKLPPFLSNIGLEIYPVVGELTSSELNTNRDEVEETFTVPLEWFINHKPIKASMEFTYRPADNFPFHLVPNYSRVWQKRSQHDVYFYQYENYVIWGLTAQIIQLFLDAIG